MSGAVEGRAGLAAALDYVSPGDTQLEMARVLLADPARPIDEVCGALRVSRATWYRHVPTHARPARAVPPERAVHLQAGRQR